MTVFIASHQALIPHPVDRIDLVDWLANLTDKEYQACSRSHRAAGIFHEGRRLGSINVESIGGHLLIQHYLAETSDPHHLVMRSRKSRAYLMHLLPVSIEVIWILEAERQGDEATSFRCTVETHTSTLLGAVARLGLMPYFISRHVREEAVLFAADINRKAAGGDRPVLNIATS